MSDRMSGVLGCAGMLVIGTYGLVQIVMAVLGIGYHWGLGWALVIVLASILFRFTLPITVGSFFGALDVWGWPWFAALLFAAPGLLFLVLMLPGAVGAVMERVRGR